MEMYGNEISVQQGENWNLDILLSASQIEYIPFIVSNQRPNPFFVVTIASTKYEKNLRYVKSWWNDILSKNTFLGQEPLPTFFQTVPVDLGEFESITDFNSKYAKFYQTGRPSLEKYETRCLYQYTLKDDIVDPETNHLPYHYSYYEYEMDEEGESTGKMTRIDDEYECHIRFNFPSSETEQWGSQNYLYQITLVSGELLKDTLESIALAHGMPEDWPVDIIQQYKYVKIQWPNELQADIDATSPLGRIDSPQVIVPPTKLQVFNNLRKII